MHAARISYICKVKITNADSRDVTRNRGMKTVTALALAVSVLRVDSEQDQPRRARKKNKRCTVDTLAHVGCVGVAYTNTTRLELPLYCNVQATRQKI